MITETDFIVYRGRYGWDIVAKDMNNEQHKSVAMDSPIHFTRKVCAENWLTWKLGRLTC